MSDLTELLARVIEDTKGMTEGPWEHSFPQLVDAKTGEFIRECREADCQVSFGGALIANVTHGPIFPAEPHGSNQREANASGIASLRNLVPRLPELLEAVRRAQMPMFIGTGVETGVAVSTKSLPAIAPGFNVPTCGKHSE